MDFLETKRRLIVSERLEILMVMPQANLGGGAEVMLLNFLLGLREVRPEWRCSVAFLRPGPFVDILKEAGLSVVSVLNVRFRNPIICARAVFQLSREIKTRRMDMVFSWLGYGQIFGGIAAFLAGVPSLWYQIGSADGVTDRVATLLPARRILCVSRHVAMWQGRMWPRHPLTSVWPGIDLEPFSIARQHELSGLRSRLGLPVDGFLAVMVGRLQRWKGMHTAIEAMAKVRMAFPNARLCIVGGVHDLEPNYLSDLEKTIARLGLTDCVRMAGLQSNIAEWMSAADVVIHASLAEPFGIVAIEAMACGRPVITGSDGGVGEAVRDGMEGIHVRFGDHLKLADAMIEIFGNPDFAAKMGLRGLERAQLFTRDRYAEDICKAMEECREP